MDAAWEDTSSGCKAGEKEFGGSPGQTPAPGEAVGHHNFLQHQQNTALGLAPTLLSTDC